MANLHHKSSVQPVSPDELLAAVQSFLLSCARPAVLEEGEELLELIGFNYTLELRGGRLWLESWSEAANFARRIVAVTERKPGSLSCLVQRFGKPPGRLILLDLDRPASAQRTNHGRRQNFAERFRRMLSRQFPGWNIQSLSAGLDLQRSFSSLYPRAELVRGMHSIAAVACPAVEDESGSLTAALLWFDHLKKRSAADSQLSLALFLPEGAGCLSAQRLKWLRGRALGARLFLFNEHGTAGEVDPDDLGNLGSSVTSNHDRPGAQTQPVLTGKLELELEIAVRGQIEVVDATLMPGRVHAQVLTQLAADRSLLDLLAIDRQGRLCVLELKADEDLQLPLQALDYWMHIRWHAGRGELRKLFPQIAISPESPRLLLVAPATSFHATNATILSYYSPEIEVERIGVNSDWNRRLTVVMRLAGARAPISHEG